jgi:hypothetical protein
MSVTGVETRLSWKLFWARQENKTRSTRLSHVKNQRKENEKFAEAISKKSACEKDNHVYWDISGGNKRNSEGSDKEFQANGRNGTEMGRQSKNKLSELGRRNSVKIF